MPKQKTHKGTKKRFRLTANGKVKHRSAGTSHLATRKTRSGSANSAAPTVARPRHGQGDQARRWPATATNDSREASSRLRCEPDRRAKCTTRTSPPGTSNSRRIHAAGAWARNNDRRVPSMRTTIGVARKRKKNRLFQKAKGYTGGRRRLLRSVKETLVRAEAFAFRDRRARKREFRKLWIIRINAACRERGLRYSEFINGLQQGQHRARPQDALGDGHLRPGRVRRDRRKGQSGDWRKSTRSRMKPRPSVAIRRIAMRAIRSRGAAASCSRAA